MARQRPTLTIDRINVKWHDDTTGMVDGLPCLGCTAVATVSYLIGKGVRRLETFTSGGLWAIDPRSTDAYLTAIEADELADLRDHLARFGLTVTDDEWIRLAGRSLKDEPRTSVQTACERCGSDIENLKPFRKSEWRDRGGETRCPKREGISGRTFHKPAQS